MIVEEERVFAIRNVRLPAKVIRQATTTAGSSNMDLVLCHGLGAKNPKDKDYTSDTWIPIASNTAIPLVHSTVLYTSRGHRGTDGWQSSAEEDLQQFAWPNLADDMITLSHEVVSNERKLIVGGSSMGAAAALYAALKYPDEVAGVIMLRPPAAWEERASRRQVLLNSAEKCRIANGPDDVYHFVLVGTAMSDFPPLDDLETYKRIKCPVLIFAVEGDDTHPLSTANALVERIPSAELVVSKNFKEASSMWPEHIARFLLSIS